MLDLLNYEYHSDLCRLNLQLRALYHYNDKLIKNRYVLQTAISPKLIQLLDIFLFVLATHTFWNQALNSA